MAKSRPTDGLTLNEVRWAAYRSDVATIAGLADELGIPKDRARTKAMQAEKVFQTPVYSLLNDYQPGDPGDGGHDED